jgi:tetratricopeptide (TPR) repeat protein
LHQGKNAQAERLLRDVHAVRMRVLGAEHPNTLMGASNLAASLADQGKYADAERIQREVLVVEKRVLGAEHPKTLTSANNLSLTLADQDKHADAERIQREVLGVRKRVLGAEHPDTLASANNLAASLADQGKYADAERIQLEVLGVQKRVLGAEHQHMLMTANNLAMSLKRQGKYAEAERMLHAAFSSLQRVLGPAHPTTLGTASNLEDVRAAIRATPPPTNAAAPAAAGPVQPLPAGTRVLVQRLAKPEHNGKRVRVLSFDARTGRYTVALDDGKELSLKAECVAKAGCAAAGYASEEASSVCSRSMSGSAVLLARVPAHGLEGAQACVHGGTAKSVGESQAAMSLRKLDHGKSRCITLGRTTRARGTRTSSKFKLGHLCMAVCKCLRS